MPTSLPASISASSVNGCQWDIRVDLISNQLGRAFILSIRFNILSADSCSIMQHSFKR